MKKFEVEYVKSWTESEACSTVVEADSEEGARNIVKADVCSDMNMVNEIENVTELVEEEDTVIGRACDCGHTAEEIEYDTEDDIGHTWWCEHCGCLMLEGREGQSATLIPKKRRI